MNEPYKKPIVGGVPRRERGKWRVEFDEGGYPVTRKGGTARPAEKTAGAGAGVLVVARALGVEDPNVLAALGVCAAAAPALVTGLIAHGGMRGLLRAVIGRKG